MPSKTRLKVKPEDIHTARFGLALVILAGILVIIFSLVGIGRAVTFNIASGISVFAVAYLMSQFIERAVEPFSEWKPRKKKKPEARLFGDTDMIKDLRKLGKKRAHKQNEELDKQDTKRTIAMWGLTSFLGILLCYLTVGLFEVVGVSFNSLPVAGRTITGHTFDSILSGMIVGGGTKPLHDLIGYLEKAKHS